MVLFNSNKEEMTTLSTAGSSIWNQRANKIALNIVRDKVQVKRAKDSDDDDIDDQRRCNFESKKGNTQIKSANSTKTALKTAKADNGKTSSPTRNKNNDNNNHEKAAQGKEEHNDSQQQQQQGQEHVRVSFKFLHRWADVMRAFFVSPSLYMLPWEDMPPWLQYNKYIRTGYRPLMPVPQCFVSALSPVPTHNEWSNIWTSVPPALLFVLSVVDVTSGGLGWLRGGGGGGSEEDASSSSSTLSFTAATLGFFTEWVDGGATAKDSTTAASTDWTRSAPASLFSSFSSFPPLPPHAQYLYRYHPTPSAQSDDVLHTEVEQNKKENARNSSSSSRSNSFFNNLAVRYFQNPAMNALVEAKQKKVHQKKQRQKNPQQQQNLASPDGSASVPSAQGEADDDDDDDHYSYYSPPSDGEYQRMRLFHALSHFFCLLIYTASSAYHSLMPCCRSQAGYFTLLSCDVLSALICMTFSGFSFVFYGDACLSPTAVYGYTAAYLWSMLFVIIAVVKGKKMSAGARVMIFSVHVLNRLVVCGLILTPKHWRLQEHYYTQYPAARPGGDWYSWLSAPWVGSYSLYCQLIAAFVLLIGGLINATRFPEKWLTRLHHHHPSHHHHGYDQKLRWIDLIGNSHNIWHVFTFVTCAYTILAVHYDHYEYIHMPC